MKVMVVDDDPIVLEVTRERLEAAGYEVLPRQSPLGTSAAILRDRPDLVLLDVKMPGLGGDVLARMLSSNPAANRPALVLHSSGSRDDLLRLARSCGAVGAITKTSDSGVFMRQLEECMAVAGLRASPPSR